MEIKNNSFVSVFACSSLINFSTTNSNYPSNYTNHRQLMKSIIKNQTYQSTLTVVC